MNHNMSQLLKHMSTAELSTEDVCTILSKLMDYGRSQVDFVKATTPEQTALARWRKQETRAEWERISKLYDLPYIDAPLLFS